MPQRSFGELYKTAYQTAKGTGIVAKQGRALDSVAADSGVMLTLGHPEYEYLQIGQSVEASAVVLFLDIRGFTKLSFVLPNEELLVILQALTAASVISVLQLGGHVIEFTGDGVMATFGDSRTPAEAAAAAALHTCSFLLAGIKDELNPQLQEWGTEPVRVGIGMEGGAVRWSRIGIHTRTQVKPIGEATFLAGKLSGSKFTNAWEAKAGAELAAWIPADFKAKARQYSFTMNDNKYSRDVYLFQWAEFGREYKVRPSALRNKIAERRLALPGAARVVAPPIGIQSGPRLLKDQPFF
jgi:class 3 adenylate cyclase